MLDLWLALALMLVLEGLLPTLAPALFRRVLFTMAQMDDRSLRNSGIISMVLGALFIYLLKQ